MRGVIAAGSEAVVGAGAEILEDGGNAVDAAVAAALATPASEPTLISPGGGGALVYRDGRSGKVRVCEFFANAPGLSLVKLPELDFYSVELDFGPTTQTFHVGAGSAAVPGFFAGLCTAHERWGSLPLSAVAAPAVERLRHGVILDHIQEKAGPVLDPILRISPFSRRLFMRGDRLVVAGDRFAIPELADTVEALAAAADWRRFNREVIGEAMLRSFGPAAGGLLTAADLDSYQVYLRPPLELTFHDVTVLTNPAPAMGGRMVALMLDLLGSGSGQVQGSAEQLHALCRAMRVADEARACGPDALSPQQRAPWLQRFAELEHRPLGAAPRTPGGPACTTHVSVIDRQGSMAAVTVTYGEGCGLPAGNTGIIMNNLMGEADLFPEGFHKFPAGKRLPTMIAPTLLCAADGTRAALGTGGANRIRTALTQVIANLVEFDLSPAEAVQARRVHFEDGVLNGETFDWPDGPATLGSLGADEMVEFGEPSFFFGGVHVARKLPDGTMDGAGDARRAGVCRVVG